MMTLLLLGRMITEGAAAFSTARMRSSVEGFMDCPPSTMRSTPRLRNSALLPSPATTATTWVRPGVDRRLRLGLAPAARLRAAVCSFMLSISISLSTPERRADAEHRARLVGVHVHLDLAVVAHHQQAVAQLAELLLERVLVEPAGR